MTPNRYQLRKDAARIVRGGHPWVFREQLSSAASVFRDGAWLRLVDGDNRVVGYGMYEAEGAIAIRVLRLGEAPPDAAWLREQLARAAAKREALRAETDALRVVHGESDGLPAVVADRFADTLVVASYSAGADALARYVACASDAPIVLLRPARRRHAPAAAPRALRGSPRDVVQFREGALELAVDLAAGHKTGTYLDLRGLRRALVAGGPPADRGPAGSMTRGPLAGARVLNLFAYTGMLGRAAEAAGAAHVTHVDASERALAFAAAHHVGDAARHRFIAADVFAWLPALDPAEQFDLVIADPPAMTSRRTQVGHALAAYRRLYTAAARHVRPGGAVVAACCTSRIERAEFRRTVHAALGARFVLERELPPEADHPVSFEQADYLKIMWWRG